jgi:hypothetical protein
VLGILNSLARLGRGAGLPGVDLSEASLLAAAARKTGLDDFGDDSFLEPMRVLLRSIDEEARLHPLGRLMARQNLIRVLANRLRIEDALQRHPEILEKELEDPILITGLQRTGTTLLHRLMAEDPSIRVLASWEAVNPAPWPGWKRTGRDPRVRAAWFAERSVTFLAPDFFAVHPVRAESPEEDVLLLEFSFLSTVPEATMHVPGYSRWLESRDDHVEAYVYMRKILGLLSWQRPGGRWLLKSPHHLEHLDSLLEVFPGARIIQLHRDPARVVASYCSMICHAMGIFTDEVDPVRVARHWGQKQLRMLERATRTRDRLGEGRFIDVMYPDLVSDPISEVRRVYGLLERRLDPVTESRMRAYVRENPKDRLGRHNYDLRRFGLSRGEVDERYAWYRKRYGIEQEEGP